MKLEDLTVLVEYFLTAYSVDVEYFYRILSRCGIIFYRILSRRGIIFTTYSVIAKKKNDEYQPQKKTLYTNRFFGSVLKSPAQMGSLSVNNSVTNISHLGTFKGLF